MRRSEHIANPNYHPSLPEDAIKNVRIYCEKTAAHSDSEKLESYTPKAHSNNSMLFDLKLGIQGSDMS